jgi:hypothetical protein
MLICVDVDGRISIRIKSRDPDHPKEQICVYKPGIGGEGQGGFFTDMVTSSNKAIAKGRVLFSESKLAVTLSGRPLVTF